MLALFWCWVVGHRWQDLTGRFVVCGRCNVCAVSVKVPCSATTDNVSPNPQSGGETAPALSNAAISYEARIES